MLAITLQDTRGVFWKQTILAGYLGQGEKTAGHFCRYTLAVAGDTRGKGTEVETATVDRVHVRPVKEVLAQNSRLVMRGKDRVLHVSFEDKAWRSGHVLWKDRSRVERVFLCFFTREEVDEAQMETPFEWIQLVSVSEGERCVARNLEGPRASVYSGD